MAGKKAHDLARRSFPPEAHELEGRGSQPRPSAREARVTRIEQFELRRGPIPDADELARYLQAHPDAPDIILTEFRNQGAHRRMLEKAEQDREHRVAARGDRLAQALVGRACAAPRRERHQPAADQREEQPQADPPEQVRLHQTRDRE